MSQKKPAPRVVPPQAKRQRTGNLLDDLTSKGAGLTKEVGQNKAADAARAEAAATQKDAALRGAPVDAASARADVRRGAFETHRASGRIAA